VRKVIVTSVRLRYDDEAEIFGQPIAASEQTIEFEVDSTGELVSTREWYDGAALNLHRRWPPIHVGFEGVPEDVDATIAHGEPFIIRGSLSDTGALREMIRGLLDHVSDGGTLRIDINTSQSAPDEV
jgi:hypothetical protein